MFLKNYGFSFLRYLAGGENSNYYRTFSQPDICKPKFSLQQELFVALEVISGTSALSISQALHSTGRARNVTIISPTPQVSSRYQVCLRVRKKEDQPRPLVGRFMIDGIILPQKMERGESVLHQWCGPAT